MSTKEHTYGREMDKRTLRNAERVAKALGYTQTAYTSTSALIGLHCLADKAGEREACIVDLPGLGLAVVSILEDLKDIPQVADRWQELNGNNSARGYESEALRELVDACKADGLEAWTFDSECGKIKQVFITDGTNIASAGVRFGEGVTLSTVHMPCRECGTGFGLDFPTVNVQSVKQAMRTKAPNWASKAEVAAVRKWEGWNQFVNRDGVLTYGRL